MIGTRAISGSPAIRFRKRTIAAFESSIASSMLMSMTWAPFSTCWRATPSASSNWPLRIRRANAFEPVTLVRSPMLTNSDPAPISTGSRPESFIGGMDASWTALMPRPARARRTARRDGRSAAGTCRRARRSAAMCSGVVPQQPPAMLRKPARANSSSSAGGDLGRLVEAGLAHRVGQAGVRIAADEGVAGDLRQLLEVGPHQRRAEGAVEADRERPGVAHAVPERRHRLAGEDAARGVGDGAGDDHRQPLAALLHQLVEGEDRRLGVERVEDRLDQEQVAAAFEQALGLLAVGGAQLGEGDVARRRIVDVGADARRLRRRPERAGDEARLVGAAVAVAGGARQARAGDVHLAGEGAEVVVGLGHRGRAEGVGLDDVGAGGEVLLVDRGDHVGPGHLQQVVVALQALRMVLEALAAVVGLGQAMALDHRAHRAVEDDDPLLQDLRQGRGAGVGRGVHRPIVGSACDRRSAQDTRG